MQLDAILGWANSRLGYQELMFRPGDLSVIANPNTMRHKHDF